MHQSLDPLAIDREPLLTQMNRNATTAIERGFQILLIHQTQQRKFLFSLNWGLYCLRFLLMNYSYSVSLPGEVYLFTYT